METPADYITFIARKYKFPWFKQLSTDDLTMLAYDHYEYYFTHNDVHYTFTAQWNGSSWGGLFTAHK